MVLCILCPYLHMVLPYVVKADPRQEEQASKGCARETEIMDICIHCNVLTLLHIFLPEPCDIAWDSMGSCHNIIMWTSQTSAAASCAGDLESQSESSTSTPSETTTRGDTQQNHNARNNRHGDFSRKVTFCPLKQLKLHDIGTSRHISFAHSLQLKRQHRL